MSEKETNKDFSYFYKLELEGINCFKDRQTLDLSDGKGNYSPWTIILGNNGTGKTTLLRILDRMQPYEKFYNDTSYISPIYAENTKFSEFHHYINANFIYKEKINYIIFKGDSTAYSVSAIDYDLFIISYGASRRMSKNPNISIQNGDNLKITSLFDDSIDLINAEEWLLQKELIALKSEESTKKKFQSQLTLVKKILTDILPDVEDIRIKPINENNSKLLIEVQTPYGWVNIRDLSFGYQTLTALIVDIAAKMMEQYPDSKNPLAEPVIILVDEIDLHLHPKWQRTVLDKLSEHFPNAQFIATSHSPLIVQAAQDRGANIVVCRKEGDRVIIDNNPDEVKGWRVDQILVSDLFNTEGSRSNEVQSFIYEKNTILSKKELSKDDKKRLEFINSQIDNLPNAANVKDIKAEDIIRKAAELLKK